MPRWNPGQRSGPDAPRPGEEWESCEGRRTPGSDLPSHGVQSPVGHPSTLLPSPTCHPGYRRGWDCVVVLESRRPVPGDAWWTDGDLGRVGLFPLRGDQGRPWTELRGCCAMLPEFGSFSFSRFLCPVVASVDETSGPRPYAPVSYLVDPGVPLHASNGTDADVRWTERCGPSVTTPRGTRGHLRR